MILVASEIAALAFAVIALAALLASRARPVPERSHIPAVGLLSCLGALAFAAFPWVPWTLLAVAAALAGIAVVMLRAAPTIAGQPGAVDLEERKRALAVMRTQQAEWEAASSIEAERRQASLSRMDRSQAVLHSMQR